MAALRKAEAIPRPAQRGRAPDAGIGTWPIAEAAARPSCRAAAPLPFAAATRPPLRDGRDIAVDGVDLAQTLAALPYPVVVCDAIVRVLFVNPAAEAVIAAGRGLRLDHGELHGGTPRHTSELRRLVGSALQQQTGAPRGAGMVRLDAVDGGWPILLAAVPVPRAGGLPASLALLLITDPEQVGLPSPDELRTIFGLTRAEAAVARQVARGVGVLEAARALGVCPATARSHLRSIFGKTGTSRQADLVRLLLTVRAPPVGPPPPGDDRPDRSARLSGRPA